MKTIATLYKTFLDGDTLSNDELVILYKHFNNAANLLSEMGEKFDLAWREAYRVPMILEGYAIARGIHKRLL